MSQLVQQPPLLTSPLLRTQSVVYPIKPLFVSRPASREPAPSLALFSIHDTNDTIAVRNATDIEPCEPSCDVPVNTLLRKDSGVDFGQRDQEGSSEDSTELLTKSDVLAWMSAVDSGAPAAGLLLEPFMGDGVTVPLRDEEQPFDADSGYAPTLPSPRVEEQAPAAILESCVTITSSTSSPQGTSTSTPLQHAPCTHIPPPPPPPPFPPLSRAPAVPPGFEHYQPHSHPHPRPNHLHPHHHSSCSLPLPVYPNTPIPYLHQLVLTLHDTQHYSWTAIADPLARMWGVQTSSADVLGILEGYGRVRRVWWD